MSKKFILFVFLLIGGCAGTTPPGANQTIFSHEIRETLGIKYISEEIAIEQSYVMDLARECVKGDSNSCSKQLVQEDILRNMLRNKK
jgi:hypothetical protein